MAFPAGVDVVALSDVALVGAMPAAGVYVALEPSVPVRLATDSSLLPARFDTVSGVDGRIELPAIATDSANVTPIGAWFYRLTVKHNGQTLIDGMPILLPKADASVALASLTAIDPTTLAPLPSSPTALEAITLLTARVADLEDAGVTTLGFYGTTPIAKPTVSGVSAAATLTSLIDQLVALGLLSSTATFAALANLVSGATAPLTIQPITRTAYNALGAGVSATTVYLIDESS